MERRREEMNCGMRGRVKGEKKGGKQQWKANKGKWWRENSSCSGVLNS